jgi:hypothetical protein
MRKFNELFTTLKNASVMQCDSTWEGSLPDEIWEEYFEKSSYTVEKERLNIKEHRHYETSITVVAIFGGLLGIRYASKVYSEDADYEGLCNYLEFYKMEEITEITYKIKETK